MKAMLRLSSVLWSLTRRKSEVLLYLNAFLEYLLPVFNVSCVLVTQFKTVTYHCTYYQTQLFTGVLNCAAFARRISEARCRVIRQCARPPRTH